MSTLEFLKLAMSTCLAAASSLVGYTVFSAPVGLSALLVFGATYTITTLLFNEEN